MEWSEWSNPVFFETINGLAGAPSIVSAKKIYTAGEQLSFSFANATNQDNQWIGVYLESQTAPYSNASTSKTWAYVSGEAGTKTFSFNTPGVYHAVLFKDGGYTVLAETDLFYIGNIPVLSTDKRKYEVGEAITVNYENAPNLSKDWIGIYKMGDTPGGSTASTAWEYISASASALNIQSANLKKGYYFVTYLMQDKYFEPGERIYIQIGDDISSLSIAKNVFEATEKINFSFENGPGTPKDYIGIYKEGDVYGVQELTHYIYVNGESFGMVEWENHNLPAGNYYAYLFTNDSYDAVSNKVEFTVLEESTSMDNKTGDNGIQIRQDPVSGKLIITNAAQTDQKMTVYDISGRLTETIHIAAESAIVNTVSLEPGVHLIHICSENESRTEKLIIK
jgi:hypothetical protein